MIERLVKMFNYSVLGSMYQDLEYDKYAYEYDA